MSWLYSMVLAGLVFANASDLATGRQFLDEQPGGAVTAAATNAPRVVKLDETERFEQTYPLSANGRVNVSNVNGAITVAAWDRSEVRLEAVKTADSRETLAEIQIKVDAQPNSFSVEADYGSWHGQGDREWKNRRKMDVEFRLVVPRGAVLDEIETVNGSVTVSDFTNYTKVSAVNGQVRATNLRGTASLSTVNGTVSADFERLEQNSKIALETVNGQVDLLIPSDSNATIKAETLNGSISNDFGLPVRKGQYVGKDLYGRVGGGGDLKTYSQIRLNSVNGGLTIGRKKDGKTPGQPTNLLNDKGRDGDDEDFDEDISSAPAVVVVPRVNIAKVNKEAAKVIAKSQKDTEAALKQAQKELKSLDPKIAVAAQEATFEAMKNLDAEKLNQSIRQAQLQQQTALADLANANWAGFMPAVEKKTESFAVKGVPKVTVDAKGCAVSVRGWDKPEVQYVVKKFSRGGGGRRPMPEVRAEAGDSAVSIKIVGVAPVTAPAPDEWDGEGDSVRVEVFVPKKSNLKIVADGEIRLENVSGDVDLSGDDESINVRDVDGRLRLASNDALVRVIGFRGDLDAKTVNGEVYLEGEFDKLSARAEDGTIVLTLPEGANAKLSSNAEVETEGFNLAKDGEKIWLAGSGGDVVYNFNLADGRLVVRGKNVVKTN